MKRIALLILLLAGPALADDDDSDGNAGPCSHPSFVTYDCLDSFDLAGQGGEDGQDGSDGIDGIDGLNGVDGIDGLNGLDGTDGVDGADGATGPMGPVGPVGPSGSHGKDFTRYLNQLRSFNRSYGEHLAATQAAQVYLPQDKRSRLTFGMSRVRGNTGLGVGYALKLDDKDSTAFTLSLGVSGGETVGNASFGFEF